VKFFRDVKGFTREDRISNQVITEELHISAIQDKITL
jgi:hypothetical protein